MKHGITLSRFRQAQLTAQGQNMVDNLKIRRPQDPTKINIHETWEVEYWTGKWNISKQQLVSAVKVVGVSAAKVAAYLGKPV